MKAPLRLALYQPDIPQNTGTILRLCACLAIPVDVIEPTGFIWDDRRLRRSGMDYLEGVDLSRHRSWDAFLMSLQGANRRLVAMTSRGAVSHLEWDFAPGDTLLMGRESAGLPDDVLACAAGRLRIPLAPSMRSLNVAVAAALAVGEGLRRLNAFPPQ